MSAKVQDSMVFLKCDCGCSMFVVEKSVWDDGDIDYNITVQDSRYDHNNATLWGRIKGAAKILFGKPVYYSDVFISNDPDRFKSFVQEINALVECDAASDDDTKE